MPELPRLIEITQLPGWEVTKALKAYVEECRAQPKTSQRTGAQHRAAWLWMKLKADQCRDAGITMQQAVNATVEVEMTKEAMRAIWGAVQKAMFNTESTNDLTKSEGQQEEIVEHINRFFAEHFGLEGIPFPSYGDEAITTQ